MFVYCTAWIDEILRIRPCTLFQFLRDFNIIINMIITLTNVKDLPILYIDIIVE